MKKAKDPFLKEMVILFVEDEEDIRESMTDYLNRRCDHVIVGSNGEEGLELYRQHRPDLVITDINMPKMTGLEMAAEIKKLDSHAYIIVTTAHSDEEFFMDSINVGVFSYVLKPLDREQLMAVIKRVVDVIKLEKELERKKNEIQLILDFQDNIVIISDGVTTRTCNKSFLDFFGVASLEEFQQTNQCICDFFIKEHGFVYDDEKSNWLKYLAENKDREHRVKMYCRRTQSNKIFITKLNESPNNDGLFIVSFTDITEFENQKERLEFIAHNDMLTGIFNRLKFTSLLDNEFHRFQRYKTHFSLIMFDIDHFKKVNDNYGHLVGDEILKQVTDQIRSHIRDTDLFARWGGEEFIILATETQLEAAKNLAEKLRRILEKSTFHSDLKVTCSFGVAQIRKEDTPDILVKRVDDALYSAKRNGRNRVEVEFEA